VRRKDIALPRGVPALGTDGDPRATTRRDFRYKARRLFLGLAQPMKSRQPRESGSTPPSTPAEARLLSLAQAAADDARRVLSHDRAEARVVAISSAHDLKIRGDRLAEAAILQRLQISGVPVLAEESGWNGLAEHSGLRWIVDPIDGSVNYARGIPLAGVSVGLWDGDHPILGVIAALHGPDVFWGVVGKGAYCNGAPIAVSSVTSARDAILCMGFPVGGSFEAAALNSVVVSASRFKKVRLFGSAAMSLAYLAAGRVDAYRENGIRLWDVAGGLAIAMAAGGTFRLSVARHDPGSCNVVATNGRLVIPKDKPSRPNVGRSETLRIHSPGIT
jgi:myo-inositol-1(or 4)-monophosphatase